MRRRRRRARLQTEAPQAALTWADVGEGSDYGDPSQVRVGTATAAMGVSAVYAAVRFKARQLSSLPWRMWALDDMGHRAALASQHWLARLLARPNPVLASVNFWELMAYHVELHGAAYAIKRRTRDREARVVELWPVPPSQCTPKIGAGSRLTYDVQLDGDERLEDVPSSEMLHIRGLYSDIATPVSPLTALRRALETGAALDIHLHSVFANKGANLIGMLEQTGQASSEDAIEFLKRFNSLWSGPRKAGSVGLIPKGFSFKFDQISLADQQTIAANDFSDAEIWTKGFGLPLSLMDETKAKYATAQAAGDFLVRFSLRPEMERYESAVTHSFMGAALSRTHEVEMSADHLLRGDIKTQAEVASLLVAGAIITPNEARIRLGEPPSSDPEADMLRARQHSGDSDTPPPTEDPMGAGTGREVMQ